jgi:hypothetical protein
MKPHQRTINRSRLRSKELRVRNRGWDGRDASASGEPGRRLTAKRLTDDRYCSRPVTCGRHLPGSGNPHGRARGPTSATISLET